MWPRTPEAVPLPSDDRQEDAALRNVGRDRLTKVDGARDGVDVEEQYRHWLTRERRSRELELHRLQESRAQNWAVGFYNDRGGYTIGKVWLTASGYASVKRSLNEIVLSGNVA